MDWPKKSTQSWLWFTVSSHYPSCLIALVHLHLVLLHPYAQCQLLFHSVHCLERTPVPHHQGWVLVISLVFLQHFCLLLGRTLAARRAFLQQTTRNFPQCPHSQDLPPDCPVTAWGSWHISCLMHRLCPNSSEGRIITYSLALVNSFFFFHIFGIRIIFALCFCRATRKGGFFSWRHWVLLHVGEP